MKRREQGGGLEGGGGVGNKKRETKNEKGMKMTETDLTIKQTLELDFLF